MNIEQVKKRALQYLLEHGSHPQAVHLFGVKGNAVVLLGGIPEETLAKQQALYLAGARAAHAHSIGPLQSVFLLSQAWVSLTTATSQPFPPSRDPDRKEALVVYGIDILTKEQRMFLFELIRDKEGVVRTIQSLTAHEEVRAVSNPFLITFLAGYSSVTRKKHKRS
jgi:hypothetical protein